MTLHVKLYCVAGLTVVWFVYISLPAILPQPPEHIARPTIKYILLWTPRYSPFNLITEGFDGFLAQGCEYYNCYVTFNKKLMPLLTDFDAIAFSGKELTKPIPLPEERAAYQKYIFAATESAHYYRVCDSMYDNYFNWTWTYRIDSDFRWGYIKIYDFDRNLVGPKVDMKWPKMSPIGNDLKKKLDYKTKGAAWFVSNCHTPGKREDFYYEMQRELNTSNYNWTVDIYGACGPFKCTRSNEKKCYEMVELDYHFYLSFENSFEEDYVTEKLLNALNHYAIPVVYGGANYSSLGIVGVGSLGILKLVALLNDLHSLSVEWGLWGFLKRKPMRISTYGLFAADRFLPPGSYLNARELGAKALIQKMNEIFNDKEKFYEYFKWRNHYKYEPSMAKDVCDLCKALNDEEKMKPYVYGDFRRWWNSLWDGRNTSCRPTS